MAVTTLVVLVLVLDTDDDMRARSLCLYAQLFKGPLTVLGKSDLPISLYIHDKLRFKLILLDSIKRHYNLSLLKLCHSPNLLLITSLGILKFTINLLVKSISDCSIFESAFIIPITVSIIISFCDSE